MSHRSGRHAELSGHLPGRHQSPFTHPFTVSFSLLCLFDFHYPLLILLVILVLLVLPIWALSQYRISCGHRFVKRNESWWFGSWTFWLSDGTRHRQTTGSGHELRRDGLMRGSNGCFADEAGRVFGSSRVLMVLVELRLNTPARRSRCCGLATSCLEGSSRSCRERPTIDSLIWQARRRRRMSRDALADELAAASGRSTVTPSYVDRWERGCCIPGPYWLGWLGVVLGVSNDQLAESARLARARRRRPHGPAKDRRRPPR